MPFGTVTGAVIDVCRAAAAARAKGLDIIEAELAAANLEAGIYDVITLWDVLEHVSNPAATLLLCYGLLKPGGILVLKCPDPSGTHRCGCCTDALHSL